jgi:hypothetical protein
MIKSDIIQATVGAPSAAGNGGHQAQIAALLDETLPEGEIQTCEDFKHLNTECCPICHTAYPHYDMQLLTPPHGRIAWVCCAIQKALRPAEDGPKAAGSELLELVFKRCGIDE